VCRDGRQPGTCPTVEDLCRAPGAATEAKCESIGASLCKGACYGHDPSCSGEESDGCEGKRCEGAYVDEMLSTPCARGQDKLKTTGGAVRVAAVEVPCGVLLSGYEVCGQKATDADGEVLDVQPECDWGWDRDVCSAQDERTKRWVFPNTDRRPRKYVLSDDHGALFPKGPMHAAAWCAEPIAGVDCERVAEDASCSSLLPRLEWSS